MTVTSLLSKLFIHTAVPDQICSLEAWHILHDFPRVLSSRFFVNLNAKEEPKLKQLETIQAGTEETMVTRQTKCDIYARRLENNEFGENLTAEKVRKMSWAQFVARVDRRGRKFSFRKKQAIVKEKPYLNLDSKRPNAGDMARYALRLHRSFGSLAEDPLALSDKDALEQLHSFVESASCPMWLKQRFRRQNKVKKMKKVFVSIDPNGEKEVGVNAANAVSGDSGDVAVPPVSAVGAQQGADESKASKKKKMSNLADTPENRTAVAEEHGFPWLPTQGEMRYSVQEACVAKKPTPKRLQMEKYLLAILGEKPKGTVGATNLMQKFVFHMLVFDLLPYSKKGNGLAKEGLPKASLQQLCVVHFEYLGSQKPTQKEQKNVKMKPYPELWEYIKDRTLRECGLSVGVGPQCRVGLHGEADLTSSAKEGQWRNSVYCPHPWRQEDEDMEDPQERRAKRARYVAGAMQEQSMGRPGLSSLHEVLVPLDEDALLCVDKETRSEWDALNPFLSSLTTEAISSHLTNKLLPETQIRTLKTTLGGLSHEDALACIKDQKGSSAVTFLSGSQAQLVTEMMAGPQIDPTQQSFVDHMCAWADAYLSLPDVCENNLPLPAERSGAWNLQESVLLLGTAGTGKTTTMQAANRELETRGLTDRIVRVAYTGVAASNMGSGARTIVSLFRLKTSRGAGPLQPLAAEEMQNMATELGDMAVLEVDEVSMVEKVVLAHMHQRLQRWRFECYHPTHCKRSESCRCGARLPFGGVKVILAGDFGQLPPVAVKDERTLLHAGGCSTGTDSMEVNLGSRLFRDINNVFRLRRIHRRAGASHYKESLLRLRDAAHTKEDVALWKSHDLTNPDCTLTAEEIRSFQQERVHLFCEKQRAGAFNGRRVGEDATATNKKNSGILRVWSVESSPLVERYSCDAFGGLRRVLHFSMGAPVMLISNLRTVWNLVNGLRGRIVGLAWEEVTEHGSVSSDGPARVAADVLKQKQKRNAAEVGGVQATAVKYLIVDFPSYVGPSMIDGHPTYVCLRAQQNRHERMPALSRIQFPVVLSYGMTVHKSQGLTLKEGYVFDMEHEPTWQPFRSVCGLAFVGLSRATDFAHIAFRHVPDYWSFRAVADTALFQRRSTLEMQLDAKHDATSARQFFGKASVESDLERHVLWSEKITGAVMSSENKKDLLQMLSVRGVLPAPEYMDKPQRLPASKLGGGRNKRNTMRGANTATDETLIDEPDMEDTLTEEQRQEERRQEELESAALAQMRAEEYRKAYGLDDEPYYEDMLTEEQIEDLRREKQEEAILAEIRAQEARDEAFDPIRDLPAEDIQMMLDEAEIERLSEERYANMGY